MYIRFFCYWRRHTCFVNLNLMCLRTLVYRCLASKNITCTFVLSLVVGFPNTYKGWCILSNVKFIPQISRSLKMSLAGKYKNIFDIT